MCVESRGTQGKQKLNNSLQVVQLIMTSPVRYHAISRVDRGKVVLVLSYGRVLM